MGRIVYKCEFGFVHDTARCRCMDSHVTTRQVECDNVEAHRPNTETESTVENLHARLLKTLDTNLGDIILPIVVKALADALEEDVKAWLSDYSKIL